MSDHDQPEQFDKNAYLMHLEACAERGETIVVSPAMARQTGYDNAEGLARWLSFYVSRNEHIHVVRFPR